MSCSDLWRVKDGQGWGGRGELSHSGMWSVERLATGFRRCHERWESEGLPAGLMTRWAGNSAQLLSTQALESPSLCAIPTFSTLLTRQSWVHYFSTLCLDLFNNEMDMVNINGFLRLNGIKYIKYLAHKSSMNVSYH